MLCVETLSRISRIYIEEEEEKVRVILGPKVKPGLSALSDATPGQLAEYLRGSLLQAIAHVPEDIWPEVW